MLEIVKAIARAARLPEPVVTADAAEMLLAFSWPFNIRELESLVLSHATLGADAPLDATYLETHHSALVDVTPRDVETEEPSQEAAKGGPPRQELETLLRRHRGNVSAIAHEIGKPRAQVYRWFRSLGIAPERYR